MYKLIFFFILLNNTSLFGQVALRDKGKSKDLTYEFVDEMPRFKDSDKPELLIDFIRKTLVYPQAALNKCIQGIVIVGFVVDSLGGIDSTYILRSIDNDCDLEAIRIVKLTNNQWTPGIKKGKIVKTRMALPILFEIKSGCKTMNEFKKTGEEKYKKGLYLDAVNEFDEILKIRPNDSNILLMKARCFIKLNKIENACQILNRIHNKESGKLKKKYCM